MNDMKSVIVPRSDQLNSDDLLAGPITVVITGVTIRPGTEQPISVHYDGDNGKPYKPCKSMCRVMVTAWGADSKQYIGRSMILYRDATVKWGGMEVGGLRISHMSDIDSALTMALTVTRANRKPYTVKPLVAADQVTISEVLAAIDAMTDKPSREAARNLAERLTAESDITAATEAYNARIAELKAKAPAAKPAMTDDAGII